MANKTTINSKTPALLVVSLLIGLLTVLGVPTAAYAGVADDVFSLTNTQRSNNGLGAFKTSAELNTVAQNWAVHMGQTQTMAHNPSYSAQIPNGWTRSGENVAYGQTSANQVVAEWMASPGHRANILGDYTHMGVGVYTDGNGVSWWVQVFAKYPAPTTPPPPVVTPPVTTPSNPPTTTPSNPPTSTSPTNNTGGSNTNNTGGTTNNSGNTNTTNSNNSNGGGTTPVVNASNNAGITGENPNTESFNSLTNTNVKEENVDEVPQLETVNDPKSGEVLATGEQSVSTQQVEREPFGPGGIVIIFLAVTILGIAFMVHHANRQEINMRKEEN